jgi:hypothetical protein
VACPFFKPSTSLGSRGERLPLAEFYDGECHANTPFAVLRGPSTVTNGPSSGEMCNRGYARGSCEHFPPDSAADAVRFSITSHACGIVKLIWILEKDYAPLQHGELTYSERAGAFTNPPEGLIAAQARAFIESSFRR